MFAVKAKIYGVLYNQSSSIAFDENLVIGQRQKTPNFSAFHWSPHGSLVWTRLCGPCIAAISGFCEYSH